jgi:hypothetical protein
MFVCLAKEAGNSFDREIAEKVGVKNPSAITHQYERTLKRMEDKRKGKKRWEKEKSAILSRFNGLLPKSNKKSTREWHNR